MPIPDVERFEAYLKRFRPIAAGPLPSVRHRRAAQRWFVFAGWAATTVAFLVMTMLVVRPHRERAPSTHTTQTLTAVDQVKNLPPLTLGRANELLAHAQSFRAVIDRLAFQSQALPLAKGTHSALAILSKENIKL